MENISHSNHNRCSLLSPVEHIVQPYLTPPDLCSFSEKGIPQGHIPRHSTTRDTHMLLYSLLPSSFLSPFPTLAYSNLPYGPAPQRLHICSHIRALLLTFQLKQPFLSPPNLPLSVCLLLPKDFCSLPAPYRRFLTTLTRTDFYYIAFLASLASLLVALRFKFLTSHSSHA